MKTDHDFEAQLVAISSTSGKTILDFIEKDQQANPQPEHLSFVLTAQAALQLFPAGLPALNHNFWLTTNPTNNQLIDVFDLNSEVTWSGEIPEYEALSFYDQGVQKNMNLTQEQAAVQEEIDRMRQDKSIQTELAEFREGEIAKRKQAIKKHLSTSGVEKQLAFPHNDAPANTATQMPNLSETGKATGD